MLAMCQNKYLADRSDKNFNELFKENWWFLYENSNFIW
jgi:hypothetical protein